MGEEERLREDLVDDLTSRGILGEGPVAAAFRTIGRHHFLPGRSLQEVYSDSVVPTRRSPDGTPLSSSSQPAIMAVMLQQLDVSPGHRVLEVGAGTGYNAALLGCLAGAEGRVTSVDIDATIVAEARDGLERAGVGNVEAIAADGADGWFDAAPYDRVIATCSADEVPEAWIRQLAEDGRIVLPLELRPGVMFALALERDGACLRSVAASPCGFMRIRGSMASGRAAPVRLADGVFLDVDALPVPAEQVMAWLRGPSASAPIAETGGTDPFSALRLWLSLVDAGACSLGLPAELVEDRSWPAVWRGSAGALTWGVVAEDGICLLDRTDDAGVVLRVYGAPTAAARYRQAAASWREAGQPGQHGVRVTTCPLTAPLQASAAAHVLRRRWSNILVELL